MGYARGAREFPPTGTLADGRNGCPVTAMSRFSREGLGEVLGARSGMVENSGSPLWSPTAGGEVGFVPDGYCLLINRTAHDPVSALQPGAAVRGATLTGRLKIYRDEDLRGFEAATLSSASTASQAGKKPRFPEHGRQARRSRRAWRRAVLRSSRRRVGALSGDGNRKPRDLLATGAICAVIAPKAGKT
jgi:hypothetical protein